MSENLMPMMGYRIKSTNQFDGFLLVDPKTFNGEKVDILQMAPIANAAPKPVGFKSVFDAQMYIEYMMQEKNMPDLSKFKPLHISKFPKTMQSDIYEMTTATITCPKCGHVVSQMADIKVGRFLTKIRAKCSFCNHEFVIRNPSQPI